MKHQRDRQGYHVIGIKMKATGAPKMMLVHRLVAEAFVPPSDDPERACVNHIDSDKDHNHWRNLEYVSYQENQVHRKVFNRDNLKASVIVYQHGVAVAGLRHVYEASEYTGLTVEQIWRSIKDGVIIDGWEACHRPRNTALPAELHKGKTVAEGRKATVMRPLQLRDIDTGEITVFESIAAVTRHFNCTGPNVSAALMRGGGPRFFLKQYQVSYLGEPFQVVTEQDIAKAKTRGPKQVFGYNCSTGYWELFVSATDFIAKNPTVSKKAIHMALLENRLKKLGDWYVLYRTEENVQRLKTHIDSLNARS